MKEEEDYTKNDPILTAILNGISELDEDGLAIVTMNNVASKLPPEIFETFPTGKITDKYWSDSGGVMRATINIIIGEPGVGKTTVLNDELSDIQEQHKDVSILFISSEESMIDRAYNHQKSPRTGNVRTLFLGDYPNSKSPIKSKKEAVETVLNQGHDIIMIDSFKDTQDKVRVESGMSKAEAEVWLIDLMVRTASGQNKKGKYTAFLAIQQVTKGGVFAGSNSLKHNTTSMLEMRFDSDGRRYVEFTKNRRGGAMVHKKVYNTFNEQTKRIEWNENDKPLKVVKTTKWSTKPKVHRGTGSFKNLGNG